jgi:hypothetical protein
MGNNKQRAPRRPRTEEQRWRAFEKVRIGDLNKLFGHRYGGGKLYQFPDDDSGREDLMILVDHYSSSNPLALLRVLKARAPWATDADREALFEKASRFPRRWTAKALGERLNLREDDRLKLKIRTIGAVDMTPGLRKRLRKIKDKGRKYLARRAANMQTRAEYLATHTTSHDRPWEAEGISRRTWYRRQKVGTGLSAMKSDGSEGHTCATEQAERPQRESSDQRSLKLRVHTGTSVPASGPGDCSKTLANASPMPDTDAFGISESCGDRPMSMAA